MRKDVIYSDYKITYDSDIIDKKYGITPEISEIINKLYYEIRDNSNEKLIAELTDLIIKYPKIPHFKNFLCVLYGSLKQLDKIFETNEWIIKEHPGYIYGILNKVNILIEEKTYDTIPELLNASFEIGQMYPERKLFHIAEVEAYYKVVIKYLSIIGNDDLAKSRLKFLKKVSDNEEAIETCEKYISFALVYKAAKRLKEEHAKRITTKPKEIILSDDEEQPIFNNAIIENIYKYDLDIPEEIIKDIISLPRTELIEDLEKVLDDAAIRYKYFSEKDWDDNENSFPLHALFLLSEIKAVDSLPAIIKFFQYKYEFIDFWLSDHKTETIWQCFYNLYVENPDKLKEYILTPGVEMYSKTAANDALTQIYLHNNERKEEIYKIYDEILTVFLNSEIEDNLIDSSLIAFVISGVIDCNFSELLPVIKELYDKGYVDTTINGNYKETQKYFKKSYSRNRIRPIYNMTEAYNDILSTWDGYKNKDKEDDDGVLDLFKGNDIDDYYDDDEYYDDDDDVVYHQPKANKTGRNDPCPCGSGNKYKKCCINQQ